MTNYTYLASPYTKHKDGIEQAFLNVCKAAAHLINTGHTVLSPIAHSHSISINGGIDPNDWKLWMDIDHAFMENASNLIVFMDDGWNESKGVSEEIETFFKAGKSIMYMTKDYEIVSSPR